MMIFFKTSRFYYSKTANFFIFSSYGSSVQDGDENIFIFHITSRHFDLFAFFNANFERQQFFQITMKNYIFLTFDENTARKDIIFFQISNLCSTVPACIAII
jgi:hypothetical protein